MRLWMGALLAVAALGLGSARDSVASPAEEILELRAEVDQLKRLVSDLVAAKINAPAAGGVELFLSSQIARDIRSLSPSGIPSPTPMTRV